MGGRLAWDGWLADPLLWWPGRGERDNLKLRANRPDVYSRMREAAEAGGDQGAVLARCMAGRRSDLPDSYRRPAEPTAFLPDSYQCTYRIPIDSYSFAHEEPEAER